MNDFLEKLPQEVLKSLERWYKISCSLLCMALLVMALMQSYVLFYFVPSASLQEKVVGVKKERTRYGRLLFKKSTAILNSVPDAIVLTHFYLQHTDAGFCKGTAQHSHAIIQFIEKLHTLDHILVTDLICTESCQSGANILLFQLSFNHKEISSFHAIQKPAHNKNSLS